MIYLDSAATTFQKPPEVARTVTEAMATCASAGRSGHKPAMRAAETLFRCRSTLAELFSLEDPERVSFTFNATDALNKAIKGTLRGGEQVLVSGMEHNAVMRPLYALREKGVRTTVVPAPLFDPERTLLNFRDALRRKHPRLVVCTHVSNVFGSILPVEGIDRACAQAGVPLIIDASQSAGAVPLNVGKLQAAAFVCMPGHKGLYGPQGTGVLLTLKNRMPGTLVEGGTGSASERLAMPEFLPDRLEPGTHNIPGVAGLEAGARWVKKQGIETISDHHRALIRQLAEDLSVIGGAEVFAAERPEDQAGVLSMRVRGQSCEKLSARLGEQEICTRAGLHCAPVAHDSAGTAPEGTLRVSVSAFNTPRELKIFARTCEKIVKNLN